MLGCYCDCPGVSLPFDANTFFNQHDLDMINGIADIPNTVEIQSDKILWYGNWSTTQWSVKNVLNGGAVITDDKLKRDVWEWMNETIHPSYFQKVWSLYGRKTPPVSILCFSHPTAWHREGPILFPENLPEYINTEIVSMPRAPAVINFRLLGDKDGSKLQFANPTPELDVQEKECIQKYFDTWTEDIQDNTHAYEHNGLVFTAQQHWLGNDSHPEKKWVGEKQNKETTHVVTSRDVVLRDDDLMNTGNVSTIWDDKLNFVTEHVGMHNPYIVNLSKWHRVLTNGEPRVTFRIHANTDLTFEDIERLHENGEFFK